MTIDTLQASLEDFYGVKSLTELQYGPTTATPPTTRITQSYCSVPRVPNGRVVCNQSKWHTGQHSGKDAAGRNHYWRNDSV